MARITPPRITSTILFSTNTLLAYSLNERYYKGEHWIWCSPCFDSASVHNVGGHLPPSSSPSEIYHRLWEDAQAGDRHSLTIELNRAGLLNGAREKEKGKVITAKQRKEIIQIVDAAQPGEFRPLMYLIPTQAVARLVKPAAVGKRAHPMSPEFVIEELPRRLFEVIELRRR